MTARPWMPLYIGDYLADTTHLGALQSGAYLHLIMHYWQHGGLPDDEAAIARIARLTPTEWRRVRPTLAAFFYDGWKHKRIDEELAHAADVSSKRRASALQKASKSSANASAIAEQMDTHARGLSQSPSEPNGSAPPGEWSDDRTNLFGGARQWLQKQTGKPENHCRKLIGRWLKQTGDDSAAILELIRQARDRDLSDPVAWIEAALKPRANGEAKQSTWPERAAMWRRSGIFLGDWGSIEDVPAEHAHLFQEPAG